MALRAIVGLRLDRPEAGGEAAERLRGLEGVSVLGAVTSRKDGVAAILISAEDLRALKRAADEAKSVEGVRDALLLMAGEDLWPELAKMDEEGYARSGPEGTEGPKKAKGVL